MTTAISTVRVGSSQIAKPGAFSQVDTTGAESSVLAGGGRLAIVGEASNGAPQTATVFSSLQSLRKAYWLDDGAGVLGLRLAGRIVYEASADAFIQGKPESVCAVKVNRDTQATGVLQGAVGALINLTSEDYGTHTNKIRIVVASGTLGGAALTIREGATVEVGDNIGKDAALTIEYTGEATTANVDIDAVSLQINYTKSDAGENGGEVVAGWTGGTPRIQSSSVADNFQLVTLYGLDAGNLPISETKELNGTTYVDFATTFTKLTGAKINGLHVGSVTVEDGADVVKATFTATQLAAVTVGTLRIASDAAADVGMVVQLIGEDAAGSAIVENISLNGTTLALGVLAFTKLLSVTITGTTAGNVTVTDSVASLVVLSAGVDASAGLTGTKGLYRPTTLPHASEISIAGSAAYDVVVRGVDDTGATIAERIVHAAGTLQTSAAVFVSITQIELGVTATTTTLAYSGEMADIPLTDTCAEVATFLNDTGAFTAISYNDDRLVSEMDLVSTVSCLSPAIASLYSRAVDTVEWINANSDLVTAARVSGASGLPVLTTTPVALSGATSPASTVADWQAAIDLLRAQEVDHIVVLSTNAAVHAYAKTHCDWADGRKERELHAGLATGLSQAAIDSATVVLNNKWVSAYAQPVQLYDDAGTLRTYSPVAQALIAAGMRASSAIGEPNTRKFLNVIALGATSWSPIDDAEAMLRIGLCFAEMVPGKGVRWVRSITTYRRGANAIYTEQSANESLAASVRDLRTYVDDTVIGGTSIRPPLQVVRQDAVARLIYQRDTAKVITSFANVTAVDVAGATFIDYDCVPILPRNFALITAHASTQPAA